MFGFLKADPKKKLQAEYEKLLEQGMHAQRNGDIKTYSMLTAQAEEVLGKIHELEKETS